MATAAAGTEIVRAGGNGHAAAPVQAIAALTIDNVWMMAEHVAASKLFPNVNTPQQAFTLMMLCQADGMHPMHALRRYHIIQGRPTMRSDAVQAEFQADGGRIEVLRSDEKEARALFSHPRHQPKPVEMGYTIDQARNAGLTAGTWKTHPADMLWARLVTKGVRRVHPGIVVGISTPEDIQDAVTIEAAHEVFKHEASLPPPEESRRGDVPVPGQPETPDGLDPRPYAKVVQGAVEATNRAVHDHAALALDGEVTALGPDLEPIKVHEYLFNACVQAGHHDGPRPAKISPVLTRVYDQHRDWLRHMLNGCLDEHIRRCEERIDEARAGRDQAAAQDAHEAGEPGPELEPLDVTHELAPGEDG
jgi:hypothetical protein